MQDTEGFEPTVEPAIIRDSFDVMRPLTFSDWLVGMKVKRECLYFQGACSLICENLLLWKLYINADHCMEDMIILHWI